MVRGLWSAVGGMIARESKQDVIANNLANAATAGFTRRSMAFRTSSQTFDAALKEKMSSSSVPSAPVSLPLGQGYTDTRSGPIKHTGNKLDFAIDGRGQFMVQDRGVTSLTRNGSFAIDGDGELVTSSGEKVLGDNGPIKLPDGEWEVDQQGNIVVNGQTVNTIRIVGETLDSSARIRQGELEMSNVSVVNEMVDMISNLRAYEANQKVVHSIDQTFDKLINEAGK